MLVVVVVVVVVRSLPPLTPRERPVEKDFRHASFKVKLQVPPQAGCLLHIKTKPALD